MKNFILISIFVFTACTNASDNRVAVPDSNRCNISFTSLGPCSFKGVRVEVIAEQLAEDEKEISELKIQQQGRVLSVKPIETISLLNGDKGFVDFSDISFDGVPDLAITSSFGVANLYLEYWVFDTSSGQYRYIGNYAVFDIDEKNKTLKNQVKVNAATYESSVFNWKGQQLIKAR